MGSPFYATREAVASALDILDTAKRNDQIDAALANARRQADRICHYPDGLWPQILTRTFDWPQNDGYQPDYRLWLQDSRMIERPTEVTVGGTGITVANLLLYPRTGPPYEWLETDVDTSDSFSSTSYVQAAVEVTGLFGHSNDTETTGALDGALTNSATTATITQPASVGVGDLLLVDSERMIVTDRAMVDSTQDTGGNLTAVKSDQSITVTDGSVFQIKELILIDSERMRVTDITGNFLTVTRAADGTTLEAHSSGADIYRYTSLTVERGAGGTTANTHDDAAVVYRWVPPPEATTYSVAEALNTLGNERSGMARTAGAGDGAMELGGVQVRDARAQLKKALGPGPQTW